MFARYLILFSLLVSFVVGFPIFVPFSNVAFKAANLAQKATEYIDDVPLTSLLSHNSHLLKSKEPRMLVRFG
ncbi:hypothetical protein QR680_016484 [Steinernema hermaphroditum]|uniref:Uncharacterized protein n=1 Tax=Steinernema hermaphroditum TaxID=289476 RepID=A0AA39HCH0_9BILA|nr:hypothetical protein QR680_016484 [Steinernema hermaphroditum]